MMLLCSKVWRACVLCRMPNGFQGLFGSRMCDNWYYITRYVTGSSLNRLNAM